MVTWIASGRTKCEFIVDLTSNLGQLPASHLPKKGREAAHIARSLCNSQWWTEQEGESVQFHVDGRNARN